MKRRLRPWVKYLILAIIVSALAYHYNWYANDLSVRREEYSKILNPILQVEALDFDSSEECEEKSTDVYFTNYFMGDGSSGTTTASGLKVTDFKVSDEGWYLYEGKVVVATANITRLKRGIAEGYRSHELYEELTIRLNGKEYQSIVLDLCGACYGVDGEFLQRYDIFTTGNVIGKVVGQIVEKSYE